MAQKRMFSLQIVDTDAFLDMPQTSQLLYFHLVMRADDEGFVGNPKKIMRLVGIQDDDLKILLAKRFLLSFKSGIVVIKHWLIHNTIRMDRFNKTAYQDEKNLLSVKENNSYTELATKWQPNGNQMAPQVKLIKVKLSQTECVPVINKDCLLEEEFKNWWILYPKKVGRGEALKSWKKIKPSQDLQDKMKNTVEKLKQSEQWKKENGRFIPNPATWLNQGRWDDEVIIKTTKTTY